MNVKELIEALTQCPPDRVVGFVDTEHDCVTGVEQVVLAHELADPSAFDGSWEGGGPPPSVIVLLQNGLQMDDEEN
jgi:hypothetical protein